MTSLFAHDVVAYTATRKWRVLKVTLQVAAPGAESAVYDCDVGLRARCLQRMHLVSASQRNPFKAVTSRHIASLRAGLTLMIHSAGRRG